ALGAARALERRVRGARQGARPRRAALGHGPLPGRGANTVSSERKEQPSGAGTETPSKTSGEIQTAPGGPEPRLRSSLRESSGDKFRASGLYRLSAIIDPRRRSGPGASF